MLTLREVETPFLVPKTQQATEASLFQQIKVGPKIASR